MSAARDADDTLISRYLDGAMDNAELADFNRRIATDTSFAGRLYQIAHLHGSLRELGTVGTENLYGGSMPPADGIDVPLPVALPAPGTSEVHRARGKRSIGSALLVAGLFLAVGVGVLYVVWPKNAATLGILKQGRNVWVVRDGNQIPVTGEMEIRAGDSLRTANNGSALLQLNDGALKLDLEGGAHLTLPSETEPPLRLELESGVVSATLNSTSPANTFIISTPQAEVALQESQATIATSPSDTRLDVHAGTVKVERKSDNKTVSVAGGQYAIAGSVVEMAALPFTTPAREKDEPDVAVVEPRKDPPPSPSADPEKKPEPLKPWEMNITSFRVLNAETGEAVPDFTPLFYSAVVEKRAFPKGFTVQAVTSPEEVGSIVFELNGRQRVFVANKPPYAVTAQKGNGFDPLDLPPGMYNLRATPYTKPNGQGKPGPYMVVRFQVVRQKGKPGGQGQGPKNPNKQNANAQPK